MGFYSVQETLAWTEQGKDIDITTSLADLKVLFFSRLYWKNNIFDYSLNSLFPFSFFFL